MSDIFTINTNGYYDESSPLQKSSTRYQINKCLVSEHTGFSHTVIVNSPDYGQMLFLDGELQSTSYDEAIYHETLVHPIMNAYSSVPDKSVLVIGGAEGATVREVLKWPSVKITWVDIDDKLVQLCKEHLKYCDDSLYEHPNVLRITDDIMNYFDGLTIQTFDVIIIDLPDPDPEMKTPLYGSDFWVKLNRALKPGGGIVTHTGPVEPGYGRQVGLKMIQDEMCYGYPYHTFIPSFQSEWGFWLSCKPKEANLPNNCVVMNSDYQNTIFHWDKHWCLSPI
jgi:spermidine synthase